MTGFNFTKESRSLSELKLAPLSDQKWPQHLGRNQDGRYWMMFNTMSLVSLPQTYIRGCSSWNHILSASGEVLSHFFNIIKISIVENNYDLFLVLYLRPVFPLFLHISIIHVFAYENVCGECLSYSHYQVTKWKYSISITVSVCNICISFLIFLSRRHWYAPISKQLFSYPYTMAAIRYVKKHSNIYFYRDCFYGFWLLTAIIIAVFPCHAQRAEIISTMHVIPFCYSSHCLWTLLVTCDPFLVMKTTLWLSLLFLWRHCWHILRHHHLMYWPF